MNSVQRSMIVSVQIAPLARQLASALPSGLGMFAALYAPAGSPVPATHAVSDGWVWQVFADALASPEALVAMLAEYGQTMPIEQATALLSMATVSDRPAHEVLTEMGLEPASLLSINEATQAQLEAAPGVGAVKAKAIIDGRPWASVDDLAAVGLSASQLAALEWWYTA